MISAIETIGNIALEELVGAYCYVKDHNGNRCCCVITRIDISVTYAGVGVVAHIKNQRSSVIDYPEYVTLHPYNHNVALGPVGFLTPMDYAKYYCELG